MPDGREVLRTGEVLSTKVNTNVLLQATNNSGCVDVLMTSSHIELSCLYFATHFFLPYLSQSILWSPSFSF